jgi:8-oxo-dGTP pyrophosphatase MutT (NUDIX family)
MSSSFERLGAETVYDGSFFGVQKGRFRHEDGGEVEREIVTHTGAVGIVVLDGDEQLWFVRQPREAVGEPDLLEIPAGKLDEEGEDPLETAKRELAEEIGKRAGRWRELKRFYTSPGFADEQVELFLATDLTDADAEADDEERIEVVAYPLDELDAAIAECADSKSLIGLLLFSALRRAGEA